MARLNPQGSLVGTWIPFWNLEDEANIVRDSKEGNPTREPIEIPKGSKNWNLDIQAQAISYPLLAIVFLEIL
jgi:hypothetical protein